MRNAQSRAIVTAVAALIAALVWGVQEMAPANVPAGSAQPSSTSSPSSSPSSSSARGHTVAGAELEDLLEQVRISSARDLNGYDRECGSGRGCVFGPAWTDDYDGPGGHDGCDTRNNVLQRDLTDKAFRPGTHDCVVISGTLQDPYTGRAIGFAKAEASRVQIDHIYPLAAAYRRGAASWPLSKRIEFANDVEKNLWAVDGSANASKGDRTPGEWMPINGTIRCDYVARFLRVAIAYDLPISLEDRESIELVAGSCPTH
jgi:hypothetical protein